MPKGVLSRKSIIIFLFHSLCHCENSQSTKGLPSLLRIRGNPGLLCRRLCRHFLFTPHTTSWFPPHGGKFQRANSPPSGECGASRMGVPHPRGGVTPPRTPPQFGISRFSRDMLSNRFTGRIAHTRTVHRPGLLVHVYDFSPGRPPVTT